MDNRYFDGIRRDNPSRSIPAFGLIGGAKQPSTQALTEALKSPTAEFSIMSKDCDGATVSEQTRVLHDQVIKQNIRNLGDAVKLLGMDYDKMVGAFKSGDEANAQEWKKSVIQYIESVKIHLDSLNGHMRALSLQTVDSKTPKTSTGFAVNPMQPSAPKKSTVPNHPVRVGDVWVTSYGYDETHYDFYVVTRVTANGAYFAKIGKVSAGGGENMFHYRSAPDPQKTRIGEAKLSVIKSHGDMRIGKGLSAKIDGQFAYPWDGNPVDEYRGFR